MRNFWICCLVILICRLLAAWVFPTFDDAFITYRYSENLISGKGLVYNAGEKILGITTPAFAIIACIPVLLNIDTQIFFIFFNIACDLGSLYLVYQYIFKENLIAFVVFATLFSIAPIINRVSIGGMEVSLFLLLSLVGAIWYLHGKKIRAFILLASIYFLRPEAIILLVIVLIYDWYITRRIPLKYGSAAALIMIVPTIFIYIYYGHPLPQSVVAKSSVPRETWSDLMKWTLFADPTFFVFTPLGCIGIVQQFSKSRLLLVLALWGVIFVLAYFVGAPHMYTWYSYSIQFIILLFATFPIVHILKRILNNQKLIEKPVTLKYYVYKFPVVAVLVWIAIAFYKGKNGVESNVYAELLSDFRSDKNIKNKVIYADDIGAIGYFTGAYIYDGMGLVTPHALNYNTPTAKMIAANADYLFIYANAKFLNMVKDDPFLTIHYTFQKRYSIHGKTSLPLPNSSDMWTYTQDYLLFKKISPQ